MKPNKAWASAEDKTGVTQPDTLRAVLRAIKPFHPQELVVSAGAAETVGAQLLGFSPQAVRHLWEAGKLALGETRKDKIDFPALSMKDAIKRVTKAAYGREMTFEHA